jgi:hypothetical protein
MEPFLCSSPVQQCQLLSHVSSGTSLRLTSDIAKSGKMAIPTEDTLR